MRRKSFIVIVTVFLTILTFSQIAIAQNNRQVWAFYLGFWLGGQSWDWQAHLLTDYPAIGRYDSRDGGLVGAQIEQAQSAGISAFNVSWFGVRNPETTQVLNNVLDRANERGFKAGAVVDIFNGFDRGHLEESLRYLVFDRANHPAYLHYNGKPVILFAFQDRANLSVADWQAIRNSIDSDRNTLWIAEGINGCCLYGGVMDGMYAFNLAWANGSASRYASERANVLNRGGSLYAATIHPGWDEDNIAAAQGRPIPTSPRDRAGGQFLINTFNGAVASGTDVLIVVSWNEFLENSHIEPSTLYGNQSLDTLRPLIANWRGTGAAAADGGGEQAATDTSGGDDNWCNLGGPWGDGRCIILDNPAAQDLIWRCGWYKAHGQEAEECGGM